MSLLINESYVNPTTPLWVSATGDTIKGDLIITGDLDVDGNTDLKGPQTTVEGQLAVLNSGSGIAFQDATVVATGMTLFTDTPATNGFIETNGTLYLGRFLAGNTANTSFTPSAPTTNGDVLAVGGRISSAPGGGITPLSSSTASTNVAVGGGTVSLSPSPVIPITTGLTYDIQVNGYFSIPLLTVPAVGDKMRILVSVGPGTFPSAYSYTAILDVLPGLASDPFVAGTTRPFSIRARLPSNANLSNIVVSGTLTGVGVYPAGIDVVIPQVSVVRVA
jgi:hypothetical protein